MARNYNRILYYDLNEINERFAVRQVAQLLNYRLNLSKNRLNKGGFFHAFFKMK